MPRKKRATPTRRTSGPGQRGAGQRAQAADRGDQADGPGREADLGREDDVHGAEDAPEPGDRGVGQGERPQDRVAQAQPQPVADLVEDAGPGRASRGFRLVPADAADEDRRDEERQRVQRDGDRRGQELDQPAADPEADELGGGAAAGQGRVRLHEPLTTDDRRQERPIGGVEERREDRGPEGDGDEVAERQRVEDEGDRDRAQQRGPSDIGPDEDRPASQAVDPDAGDEAHREPRDELGGAQ